MKDYVGEVTAVTFIRNVCEGLDLCKLRIDFDEIFIYYDKDDLNQFLNQKVQYNKRLDLVDGKSAYIVIDIAIMKTVQTVESIKNVKLIPEGNSRTVCNFAIKDILFGSFNPKCVSFLSKVTRGASDKTKWCDMTMLDIDSREFTVRIFTKDPTGLEHLDETIESYVGSYVQYDLNYTRYGYQVEDTLKKLSTSVELSPEVTVALAVVKDLMQSDPYLGLIEASYDFTNTLLKVIDGEPGYALVRMASEIYMINALDSISSNLNIPTMKRAVVCSRLYLMPSNKQWSRPLLNVNKTSKIKELREDDELMGILDPMSGRAETDTMRMYVKVRSLVNDIINIRRGVIDEEVGSDSIINSCRSKLGGLL